MLLKKLRAHRPKIVLGVGGLCLIWLVLRIYFPFGISKATEESAIRELFATAQITHIRIIYACCGNEAPVESPEVVCSATQRTGTPFKPLMSRKSFEHNKEVFGEMYGRASVEGTFVIRLPPADEAPSTKDAESEVPETKGALEQ